MSLPWLARVAGARALHDLRLLLAVFAVTLVCCTLLSSLVLLVTVTEEGGLRSALGASAADRTRIEVTIAQPSVAIADAESAAASAVESALADRVPVTSTTSALTGFAVAAGLTTADPVLAYLAELEDVASQATLVDGEWPGATSDSRAPDATPVAIPEAAAAVLEVGVGSRFSVGGVGVEVAGVYGIDDAEDPFWSTDLLAGAGIDRAFPLPGSRTFVRSDAVGPLIVDRGALDVIDAAALDVQSLDIRFQPDFDALELDDLGQISERLDDARIRIPARAGDIGERVSYASGLPAVIDETVSGLLVTRATVITAGLLLLLVAVVALAQTAKLVTDSRVDERRLLRARGASLAGIRGLSAIEVAAVAVVAAAASPPLATVVHRVVAAHPAMRAAGIPADAGLPPIVWAVAAGAALVFAAVVLAPLARAAEPGAEDRAERAARRVRGLGVVRLGIDLGVVVLAIVLYQQLVAYRAPVEAPSARVDPILVAAPALLLAACAYLAVRLVPVVAATFEHVASRSPGAVLPLAAWEVGRRARQITAVVLLLTLALGVGSFGSTFLATWRQSQHDQVAVALGAPVRVPADPALGTAQAASLAEGAAAVPQPVLRRFGEVAGASAVGIESSRPRGPSAQILGLSAGARELMDRGRIGDAGGTAIERMLRAEVSPTNAIEVPTASVGVAATVRIGDAAAPFPGVVGVVSAVVESPDGLLSTVRLGAVPVDGADYPVEGLFAGAAQAKADAEKGTDARAPAPTGFVGLVVDFGVEDPAVYGVRAQPTRADILIRDLVAIGPGAVALGSPLVMAAADDWIGRALTPALPPPRVVPEPDGWQLALRVSIPQDADSGGGTFSLTGWDLPDLVPVVATADLARLMSLQPRAALTIAVDGAQIPARLVGAVPTVPGSSRAPAAPGSLARIARAETSGVVVIDHVLLARALIGAGATETAVDEWWVDVVPGQGPAYLDRLADGPGAAGAESSEVVALEQSEGPLRIALPAALSLVIAAAVALTVAGFAVHTAASLRSRRTEFAQLRAIGLTRRSLVQVVGLESVLISVLGTFFGIVIGVVLAAVVAPLVGLSPDGSAPQPPVAVIVPVGVIAALAAVIALVVLSTVLAVAGRQRAADPAGILRGADG